MRTGLILPLARPLLITLFSWLIPGSAIALVWNGNASIAPGLFYTDNVCLSKNDRKSDWTGVAILTPAGSVSGQSSKTSFSASGSIRINTLTNGDLRDDGCSGDDLNERQKFFPSINTNLSTVLIDDWVRLNASGRADQNTINTARAGSNDGLDRNGNTNTFYRYSVSPHLARRVKDYANYNLRYSYDDQINTADTVSNSYRHAATTSLSNTGSQQISWNLSGRYTKVVYEDGVFNRFTQEFVPRNDTVLRNATLRMGYQYNRRWQINGTYGWEWNDIQTFNNADTGGNAWDIGFRWTPSPRTSVSLGSGDRFFGKTPRLAISHQHKRNTFNATYNKKITFQRDISTTPYGTVGESEDVTGTEEIDEDELLSGNNGNSSINSNSAILDERFGLRWNFNGQRANISAYGSYSKQTRAEDGAQGEFKDLSFTYSPQLSSKFTLSGSIAWSEDRPTGFIGIPDSQQAAKSENWYYRVVYTRPLNNRMTLNLNYQFSDRKAETSLNEYTENRVVATVNIRL